MTFCDPSCCSARRGPVASLFARALDDDAAADHALWALAPWDTGAAAAFDALVLVETEALERAGSLPPVPSGVADQLHAAIRDAAAEDVAARGVGT